MNDQKTLVVRQWILSLAISVVCCAILFLFFSIYVLNVKERADMAEIRIELLQGKYNQLTVDMEVMRRHMRSHINPPSNTEDPNKLVPIITKDDKKGPLINE